MRILFSFMCVLALGLMGCSETSGTGGTAGTGGVGGDAGSAGTGGVGGSAGSVGVAGCSYAAGAAIPCLGGGCPDDVNECTASQCIDEMCVYSAVEDGTPCDEDNECAVSGACTAGECSTTPIEDGTPCGNGAGTCVSGSCSGRFECSQAGIREAIAVGGGPHTFDCDGPTTLAGFSNYIDNDVILDGEDNLTLGGAGTHNGTNLTVSAAVTLRRLSLRLSNYALTNTGRLILVAVNVTGSDDPCDLKDPWHIATQGFMCMYESTFADGCSAILTAGYLEVVRSTIRDNSGAGIGVGAGTATLVNTTLSNNDVGIGGGPATVLSSTFVGGTAITGNISVGGSIVQGDCGTEVVSLGDNIERPSDTCGFDQPTDQVNVSADDLKLGELADNGGPTLTHALGAGSVAIDNIPEADCVDAEGEPLTTDQRGVMRPQGDSCDAGAFELEVTP